MKNTSKDNRLDYMSKFEVDAYEKMSKIRSLYMKLDDALREIVDSREQRNGSSRCGSLARTHLETSQMYAIKTICILHEEI